MFSQQVLTKVRDRKHGVRDRRINDEMSLIIPERLSPSEQVLREMFHTNNPNNPNNQGTNPNNPDSYLKAGALLLETNYTSSSSTNNPNSPDNPDNACIDVSLTWVHSTPHLALAYAYIDTRPNSPGHPNNPNNPSNPRSRDSTSSGESAPREQFIVKSFISHLNTHTTLNSYDQIQSHVHIANNPNGSRDNRNNKILSHDLSSTSTSIITSGSIHVMSHVQ